MLLRVYLHGDIVGDDGLFLEFKLLENVGLKDLFDLWGEECVSWSGLKLPSLVMRSRSRSRNWWGGDVAQDLRKLIKL